MTAHEGPFRCRDHGTIEDYGCPVFGCSGDHPLVEERCGGWCDQYALGHLAFE